METPLKQRTQQTHTSPAPGVRIADATMASATPTRASSPETAAFTRPLELETPSNNNMRNTKRRQRDLDFQPPPCLNLGEGAPANNRASKAVNSQLEAIARRANTQRTVITDFAATVDKFVASYETQPEQWTFAQDLCTKVIQHLSNTLSIGNRGTASAPIQIQEEEAPPATYAAHAKTLKNSGADFHKQPVARATNGRAVPGPSGGRASLLREDRRILITVKPQTLLNRPQAFAIRHAISRAIAGATLEQIPTITPTATGWAITPKDLLTRDLLMTQGNKEIILQITDGKSIQLPVRWYTYAVPGVPTSLLSIGGGPVTSTDSLIAEEVFAQTNTQPISCKAGHGGVDERTRTRTYVISFLTLVNPFRLFNVSERSRIIAKKQAIRHHDPGCQGYCNTVRCTRTQRCSNCSMATSAHEGPAGLNCTAKPKCYNCHGPFKAGHELCPAKPKRLAGSIIRLTKKQQDEIRRHGDRATHATRTASSEPSPQAPESTIQVVANVGGSQAKTTRTQKRGLAVIEHENTSSTPSSSGRPRRATASLKNLNEAALSRMTGMDIDFEEQEC